MPIVSNQDWNDILTKEKKLDFFLNVTVPAAQKRNDIIPHTLIICKYPRLTQFILDRLSHQLITNDIRFVESFGVQPGDLAAMLTNIADGTILCVKDGNCISKMNSTLFDILQQAMGSIFRQVNIEADRDTAEDMGIEFDNDESDNKKISFINKDSFVIRRSLSLHELKVVIHNLHDIEKEPDKFPLNYLVPARKKRLKNADLFNVLVETIAKRDLERFILTGDDYTTFYTGADKYILRDEEGNELINTNLPILFEHVIAQIANQKLPKGAICAMLKQWTLSTYDNTGRPIMYGAIISPTAC